MLTPQTILSDATLQTPVWSLNTSLCTKYSWAYQTRAGKREIGKRGDSLVGDSNSIAIWEQIRITSVAIHHNSGPKQPSSHHKSAVKGGKKVWTN